MLPDLSAEQRRHLTRRWFLSPVAARRGSAAVALNSLLRRGERREPAVPGPTAGSRPPLARPHFAPKAKRVIFLFMAGARATSSCSTTSRSSPKFDGKLPPRRTAQGLPGGVHQPELEAARPEVQVRQARPVRGPSCRSCCRTSAKVADDIAIVKSMIDRRVQPRPGQIMMNTGAQQFGRPSIGAWYATAWAASRRTCPGFVVFSTGSKGPSGGNSNWGSGFLPTVYQGVPFRTGGDPVLYLSNPRGVDARHPARLARRAQRAEPDAAGSGRRPGDRHADQLATRWPFRMQASAPD